MAIAHDNSTSSTVGTGTSLTFSKTNTGSNLILWVWAVIAKNGGNVSGITVTCTYNGVSMTDANGGTTTATPIQAGGSTTAGVALFRLASPATGANNVVVTASASCDEISATAHSYTGVAGVSGFTYRNSLSAANSMPLFVLSQSGDVVFSGAAHGTSAPVAGQGLTRRANNGDDFSALGQVAGGDEAGRASTSINWTTGSADHWVVCGVNMYQTAPPPGIGSPYVVDSASGAIAASRSPSVTFYDAPRADDVVIMWPSSTGVSVTLAAVTGWENPLGGTTDVESDSHEICCVAHVVTAAEAAAVTKTFTVTNLFSVAQTGDVNGLVVRQCDPSDIFAGASSTFNSTNTVTPHVLSGVTPDRTNGLVLSSVAKDATGAYTTVPTGWTHAADSNTNQGRWTGVFDTLSTANSAVSATNITPSAGDEYASITVVMNPVQPSRGQVTVVPSVAVHRAANW